MGPEDPPVNVHFIDYHVNQLLEKVRPARVIGQDSGVKHVRIGQQQPCVLANSGAVLAGGIAVVDGNRDMVLVRQELFERLCLILGERLGGEQIQRARFLIGKHTI